MKTKAELTKRVLEAIQDYEKTFETKLYVEISELDSKKPKQTFTYSGVSFRERSFTSNDVWNGVRLD